MHYKHAKRRNVVHLNDSSDISSLLDDYPLKFQSGMFTCKYSVYYSPMQRISICTTHIGGSAVCNSQKPPEIWLTTAKNGWDLQFRVCVLLKGKASCQKQELKANCKYQHQTTELQRAQNFNHRVHCTCALEWLRHMTVKTSKCNQFFFTYFVFRIASKKYMKQITVWLYFTLHTWMSYKKLHSHQHICDLLPS